MIREHGKWKTETPSKRLTVCPLILKEVSFAFFICSHS
jgi:hypothetical protein